MKKFASLLLALALLATFTACDSESNGGANTTATTTQAPALEMNELDFTEVLPENCTETETVTDYVKMNISYTDENGAEQTGDVIVRLYAEVAPVTVRNFQKLVKNNFYDGLTFHRVVEGFMIQGGAPKSSADAADAIKGEFTSNGFKNNLKHLRGVISMARTYIPDSASSQFFIMHQTNASLDGDYAAFGYVVYGMDTVDAIAKTEVKANPAMNYEVSAPVDTVTINYMTFVSVTLTK